MSTLETYKTALSEVDRLERARAAKFAERFERIHGKAIGVPHTSESTWPSYKSTQNPSEYALLKRWSLDPNTWTSAQVEEFEKWDGVFRGPGEDVWAAMRERQTRLSEVDSSPLRAGTNPPSEELSQSAHNMVDRLKALQERIALRKTRSDAKLVDQAIADAESEATALLNESDGLMREIDISAGKSPEAFAIVKRWDQQGYGSNWDQGQIDEFNKWDGNIETIEPGEYRWPAVYDAAYKAQREAYTAVATTDGVFDPERYKQLQRAAYKEYTEPAGVDLRNKLRDMSAEVQEILNEEGLHENTWERIKRGGLPGIDESGVTEPNWRGGRRM